MAGAFSAHLLIHCQRPDMKGNWRWINVCGSEIRAIVADGEPAARHAVALLLKHELRFHMVRQAATPDGLRRQLQRLCPDILVMDWGFVAAGPLGLVALLRGLCPGLRILALDVREEVCESALASGADSFVGKGDPPARLVQALRRLASS